MKKKQMRQLNKIEKKVTSKNYMIAVDTVNFLEKEIISLKHDIKHQINFNAEIALRNCKKRLLTIESEVKQYKFVIKNLKIQLTKGVEVKVKVKKEEK